MALYKLNCCVLLSTYYSDFENSDSYTILCCSYDVIITYSTVCLLKPAGFESKLIQRGGEMPGKTKNTTWNHQQTRGSITITQLFQDQLQFQLHCDCNSLPITQLQLRSCAKDHLQFRLHCDCNSLLITQLQLRSCAKDQLQFRLHSDCNSLPITITMDPREHQQPNIPQWAGLCSQCNGTMITGTPTQASTSTRRGTDTERWGRMQQSLCERVTKREEQEGDEPPSSMPRAPVSSLKSQLAELVLLFQWRWMQELLRGLLARAG